MTLGTLLQLALLLTHLHYRLFALLLQRLKCERFRIVVMLETDPRLLNGTMTTVEAF